MAVYRADKPRPFRKKRAINRIIPLFVSLVVIGVIGLAAYFYIQRDVSPPTEQDSRVNELGYYDPNQTFTTDYFTFRAPKSWRFIERDSKDGKYVYQSFNSTNLEQELTITVNKKPQEGRVTYVLPVTVSGSAFSTGKVSERCSTYLPKSNFYTNPADLVYEGAKYSCWTDNTQVFLGVSAVGGDGMISLERKNGEKATYHFRLLDSRFSPRLQDGVTILSTFKAL